MNVLEIKNVTKRYGTFCALDNISFKVQDGDFIGLLGVNGAGKTSLISSISGVNNFDGKITVMGHDVVNNVVKAKQNIGVVPQEIAFDPFLTVRKTLNFQAGLYGVQDQKEWINEVVERMHLKDKLDTNTRALSGGMKRRLMVAQALVHKPRVIILDEPTAGVDVEIRKSLWDFILDLHKNGHTILLTTHYLEEVQRLCNKIIMLDHGKIIAESLTKELINDSSVIPTTLQIETSQIPRSLENLVIKHDDENIWTLRLNSSDDLLPILTEFKQSGIRIENLNINKPSIEDVFMNYLRNNSEVKK